MNNWWPLSLVIFAALLSIAAFSMSAVGAGLSHEERIELYTARVNITNQQVEAALFLSSLTDLQGAIDNTSQAITLIKERDVPTLVECQSALDSFYPLVESRVQTLESQLDAFDMSTLNSLNPLVDDLENMVQSLASTFDYVGVVTTLQEGTFHLANTANATSEFIVMSYSLKKIQIRGTAELYFIVIPPIPGAILQIETVDYGATASVLFSNWDPPLLLGGLTQTPTEDAILDHQRGKLQVTPTTVLFNQRRYNLLAGEIEIVDTERNFTQGDLVRVTDAIELNVGYL